MIIPIPIDKGWLPDYLPFEAPQGALIEAKNYLPYDEFYSPASDKVALSTNTMTGVARQGIEYTAKDGQKYVFIGTDSKLYRLEPSKALTNITRLVGGDYATGGNQWYFSQYGEQVVATNFSDVPQILKPDLTSANFAALGGSPPKAKYVIFYYGHLIFAYVDEAGTINPKKLIWSARENIEDYAVSLSTGADSQVLADADGEIIGLALTGELLTIFHENSITLGLYTGHPFTYEFRMNKIRNIGAIPGTIISIGDISFFWSRRDIYAFNGTGVTPIGGGVRNAVLDNLNIGFLNRITVAHDKKKALVYWAYPTAQSADGTPDRILVYNYNKQRFTHIDISLNCIFSMTQASSLSSLDAWDATYPSLDTVPYYMDSNVWMANTPILACGNTDNKVASFTGNALTGVIETAEYRNGGIFMVQRVRPRISNAVDAVNIKVGGRFKEQDLVSYSNSASVGNSGYANLRKTGRFLRINLTTGQHSGLSSLEAEVVKVGDR